ncbi:MAG TPA: hypothetical protein VMG61_14765 [Usitatibacter sp.]|nr:hypothetical protein [Usitatibacter sp.]
MKNVTITLDEHTAAWVRVYAARMGGSVSRVVGDMLRAHMRDHKEYEQSMRRFLAKGPVRFRLAEGKGPPSREELHDRDALR